MGERLIDEFSVALAIKKAAAAERAAIVAWLRALAEAEQPSPYRNSVQWFADAIERGDHLSEGEGGR